MMSISSGNASQSPALSRLHRDVVGRLSVLLLDSNRMNESVMLVRTLTNAYSENELSAKISFHGKDLILLLNQNGKFTEAVQWDQKIGRVLNGISPDLWQTGVISAISKKVPAASSRGQSSNGSRISTNRSTSAQETRKTIQSLKQALAPNEGKGTQPPPITRVTPTKPATASTQAFPSAPKAKAMLRAEPKFAQEDELKVETMPEMMTEMNSEPKARPLSESRYEQRPGPMSELNSELKSALISELRNEAKTEPKSQAKPEPKSEAWVVDKMGFPLSKPLFDSPLAMPKLNTDKTASNGILISQESSNSLKNLKKNIVNLNFKDANIADIVLMLAEAGGLNIVSRNEIKGKTTITFSDMPVGTALDLILRTNNYTYQVRDDVIWIFRRGEEPISTKVFFVRNTNVDEILPTIKRSIGQETGDTSSSKNEQFGHSAGGGSNSDSSAKGSQESSASSEPANSGSDKINISTGWSVYSDTPSNSLIVTASLVKLEEIARLLAVLDVGNTGYKLEERVFTLKYIDRDSFIKTIKMTLPKFDETKQIIDVKRN
ncbi:MAG: secretin and TonB N-terminal domain-containing protein [Terrimicrobiaceae bacterium]